MREWDRLEAAVSIQGLTKRYGKFTAVRGLNLEVAPGEILGFLGLNGAGKTTTIRILLDLLRPSEGRAFVFGHDCQRESLKTRAEIGYLPAEMNLYADMTGREVLELFAGLQSRCASEGLRAQLMERFELPDRDLQRKLREFSTGMKRKLGIIQAFQCDPQLLILDEPTEGLDPLMQEAFYGLLAEVRARGRTVFMSSHVLSEVERVCDRIALLRAGELVLLRPVNELRNLASRRVRVILSEPAEITAPLPAGSRNVATSERTITFEVEGVVGPLLESLKGLPIADLEIDEARLEEVVLRYYRGGVE